MGKNLKSVDSSGNPYNFIVVIDAGSKGSRAHLYRVKKFTSSGKNQHQQGSKEDDDNTDDENANESDDDDDDDDDDVDKYRRSWVEESKNIQPTRATYPQIELIKHKKVKPGIASFVGHPKKLGQKYIGKLLDSVMKHIPEDQISRTPVFLHATGGMRLLRPDEQHVILNHICEFIQESTDLFLPDCKSHINAISGEVEGLYSWIGLNYKYGKLDIEVEDPSTFGMLDMGGVSSQIAFEPDHPTNEDILFHVKLNYLNQKDALQHKVFSRSLLSGMHQAHSRYDDSLIEKNNNVDPCLPLDYIKTVESKDGQRVDVNGGGDFKQCVTSLYDVLLEVNKDKYCDPNDSTSASSCLLSDELPKMDFNVSKFIGVNELYSNLKSFMNYKDFYENTKKICETRYADLLSNKGLLKDDEEKASELCFKSSWLIDVLHQGVNFPRYGIDEDVNESDIATVDNFGILDTYSWTLGRAVLYSYYEAALQLGGNTSVPDVGFYEPSSPVFWYGGEAPGIPQRPEYLMNTSSSYKSNKDDNHDDDDDDDDDDDKDWDNVFHENRLSGSLVMLFLFVVIGWLLMGRQRRQIIVDKVKRWWAERTGPTYGTLNANATEEDLELGDLGSETQDREINLNENQRNHKTRSSDSFELSD